MTAKRAHSFDLFISYAKENGPWVEGYLRNALNAAGLRVHSEEAFTLGAPRILEFERAIKESARTLLVLSPAYVANKVSLFVDLLGQSYGLETATWPVIPLLIEPVELPTRLGMLTYLDATDPAEWEDAIARLLRSFERPVPETTPIPNCPYPGMIPFTEEDSAHFFGRAAEVQEMLERLRLHPFLTVIGPSGSGKSSLVFAGLLPELRQSQIFGKGQWQIATMRPGETPHSTLKAILEKHRPPKDFERVDGQLLLFIDQFEETFTSSGEEALTFQEALQGLTQNPNLYIIITVRADFYTDLMSSPLWKEIRSHRIEVTPLDTAGLRDAIVRPAEQNGVFIENTLVERLLIDAAGEPGALPLIQETLVLLWEKIERRFLPLRAYASLILPRQKYGESPKTGLQIAIARRADAAFANLSAAGQAIARRVFLRLVQFGEGRADTRRQQPLKALESEGEQQGIFLKTINHLTDRRLLTVGGDEHDDALQRQNVVVDIAHEALIQGWPQLKDWISTRREAEQTRRRLEIKAAEWARLGSGEGGLLDDYELLEAENWLASPDAVDLGYSEALHSLTAASRKARDAAEKDKENIRQRELVQAQKLANTQRQRAVVLTAGLVIAIVLSILSFTLFQSAESRRVEAESAQLTAVADRNIAATALVKAENQTILAQAGQLSAQARVNLQSQYDLALLLSLESDPELINTVEMGGNLIEGLEYFPQIDLFLHGHTAPVTRVMFSPDGEKLASGSMNGEIFIWDLASADLEHEIHTDMGTIQYLRFLPDHQTLLAIGTNDSGDSAALWDLETFEPKKPLSLDRFGDYWNVTVSPDGLTLAFVIDRTTLVFWDVITDQQIGEDTVLVAEPTTYDWISGMAFSSNNQYLALYLGNREHKGIVILDTANRELVGAPMTGHANEAGYLLFGPESDRLVSSSSDGSTMLWDSVNLRLIARLPNSASWPSFGPGRGLAFAPNGGLLAMGKEDGKIVLWDLVTNQAFGQPLMGREGEVLSLAFSNDSKKLAAGGMDNSIVIWNLDATHRLGRTIADTDYYSTYAQFSPDGQSLAWVKFIVLGPGDFHYNFTLWDINTRTITNEFSINDQLSTLSFNKNGNSLLASSWNGVAYSWNFDNNELNTKSLLNAENSQASTPLAEFTSDGGRVAYLDPDIGDFIYVWDLVSNTEVTRIPWQEATNFVFSPDDRVLAVGNKAGEIVFWSTETWHKTASVSQPDGEVLGFAYSPDGSRLASVGNTNTIYLWDTNRFERIHELKNSNSDAVHALAFSTDGNMIATGHADGTISLWDTKTYRLIGEFATGYRNGVRDLDFSPDDDYLVSSGGDNDTPIIIWNFGPASWRIVACHVANRNLSQEEWQEFFPDKPYHKTCPD